MESALIGYDELKPLLQRTSESGVVSILAAAGIKRVTRGKWRRAEVMRFLEAENMTRAQSLAERRLQREVESLQSEVTNLKSQLYQIASLAGGFMAYETQRGKA
ncbi:MAG: hypothetical protein EP149_09635 [Phascolarctobacterium sp.]|nr:hypothetical protein [Phascolarctobacterium sp.]MUU07904.1 hypothetical protein [Phascolarctobacterium sp.]MUU17547.1 hypothetical protein [Phascolarctobacterium sp.]